MGFRKNDLHSRYAALRTDPAADTPPTREWRAATRAAAIRRIDLHGRHEGSSASPAIVGSAESRAKRDRAGALHRRYGAGFSGGASGACASSRAGVTSARRTRAWGAGGCPASHAAARPPLAPRGRCR
jgi:hypothetical protein